MWAQVPLVLLEDNWLSLLTSDSVTERSLNNNLLKHGAVLKADSEGVWNGAEGRIMVVLGELWVLNTLNLLSQALDQWGGSSLAAISVVGSLQASVDKHDRSHVLDAVITVSKVVHWLELLVNDADAGLVGAARDMLNVLSRLAHGNQLLADFLGGLNGGLGVELGWVGDLEQDVLHDVRAVWALELEWLALEEDIVETPDWSGENGRNTWLAGLDLQGEVDGALASVTGSPGLAGHGVWRVAVGAERLAINPGLGDGSAGLLLGETKELGNNRGGGDLDEDNVVKTDLVVRVEKGQAALDLVGLDHGLEDLLDGDDLAVAEVAAGAVGAGDPVGDRENGAQVVRWVTPLGGQPAVVVVQPADHGTNVEGSVDWVKLEVGSWDLWAIWNDGTWDGWAQELGALLEAETLETAAKGVEEDEAGSVELVG